MVVKEYKCPNCGAAFKIKPAENIIECQYCNTVVDLERSHEDISSEYARELAERLKKYRNTRMKIIKAKQDCKIKSRIYSNIQTEQKKIPYETFLTFGIIWLFTNFLFGVMIYNLIDRFEVLRICLDVSFMIGSGYGFFIAARSIKRQKDDRMNEKAKQAHLQMKYANKVYKDLLNSFDEDFIPEEVRNDEAIKFMINALEAGRAFTLNQAVDQWKNHSAPKEQFMNYSYGNVQNNPPSENKKPPKKEAGLIGFTGGVLGGAMVKKAVDEIFKNI